MFKALMVLAAATTFAVAQEKAYAQCGGENYKGSSTCVTGYTCVDYNPFYSQCVPDSEASSLSSTDSCGSTGTSVASSATDTAKATSTSVPIATTVSSPSVKTSAMTKKTRTWTTKKFTTSSTEPTTSATEPSAPYTTKTTAATSTSKAASTATEPATSETQSATSTTSKSTTSTASTATASSSIYYDGATYNASFTAYGTGDYNGSPNCNTLTNACAFYTNPGYAVAASQALYGVGPGAGAGPDCGLCYKLVIETDSSGTPLSNAGNSIIVKVTNLCPAEGNPLCSQSTLEDTNEYGANVNIDTCINSGASDALFGDSGTELGLGKITQVDCSEWSGTVVS